MAALSRMRTGFDKKFGGLLGENWELLWVREIERRHMQRRKLEGLGRVARSSLPDLDRTRLPEMMTRGFSFVVSCCRSLSYQNPD